MLRPSYNELMEKLNSQHKVDSKITSRYTIVLATAKRARQIIDGAAPLTYAPTDRAVSIAVKELDEGKLIIKSSPHEDENSSDWPASYRYYKGVAAMSNDELREEYKDKYEPDIAEDDDEDDEDLTDEEKADYTDDDYKDDDSDDDLEKKPKDDDDEFIHLDDDSTEYSESDFEDE
jgi:DNA-directed RNA polymerase subunit omega